MGVMPARRALRFLSATSTPWKLCLIRLSRLGCLLHPWALPHRNNSGTNIASPFLPD
jgi:hypothetical protein